MWNIFNETAEDHPRSFDAPAVCWPTAARLTLRTKCLKKPDRYDLYDNFTNSQRLLIIKPPLATARAA